MVICWFQWLLEKESYPRKLTWQWKNPTIWRCTVSPIKNGDFPASHVRFFLVGIPPGTGGILLQYWFHDFSKLTKVVLLLMAGLKITEEIYLFFGPGLEPWRKTQTPPIDSFFSVPRCVLLPYVLYNFMLSTNPWCLFFRPQNNLYSADKFHNGSSCYH